MGAGRGRGGSRPAYEVVSPRRSAVDPDWFVIDPDFLDFADGLRPWQAGDQDVQEARFPEGDLPHCRPLRIYTQDPAASSVMGNIATINLPFEPLAPGLPLRPRDREAVRFGHLRSTAEALSSAVGAADTVIKLQGTNIRVMP